MSLSILYEYTENDEIFYKCKCSCGKFSDIRESEYDENATCDNCPELKSNMRIHNFLTIENYGGSWLCECICGKAITVPEQDLINGVQKSCGCCAFQSRMRPFLNFYRFKDTSDYPNKYKTISSSFLNLLKPKNRE